EGYPLIRTALIQNDGNIKLAEHQHWVLEREIVDDHTLGLVLQTQKSDAGQGSLQNMAKKESTCRCLQVLSFFTTSYSEVSFAGSVSSSISISSVISTTSSDCARFFRKAKPPAMMMPATEPARTSALR